MTGLSLTDKELAAMRAVVDDAPPGDPGPVLPWSLLEAVRTLLHADEVDLDQTDPQREWLGFMQSLGPRTFVPEEPHDPHFWDLYWHRSEARIYRPGGDAGARVTLMTDHVPARRWRSDPMYLDYLREAGLFYEIGVNLPEVQGRALRLHCWREPGRDFTETDRLMLTLLRPHLVRTYRAAVQEGLPVELTPRQRQLLEQVGQGLTNRQVARRLGISEGTVRRHLNDIYARLGVSGRTAALHRIGATLTAD